MRLVLKLQVLQNRLWYLQCQSFQVDVPLEDFREKCGALIQIVRDANPDIPIVVQIATHPREGKPGGREVTLEELKTVTNSISDLVDGIGLMRTSDTMILFEQYIEWMRSESHKISAPTGLRVK